MQLQIERVGRCVERFKGEHRDLGRGQRGHALRPRGVEAKRAPKLTEAIAKMGIGEYVRTAFKTARAGESAGHADHQRLSHRSRLRRQGDFATRGRGRQALYDVIGIQSHMHGGYWGAARTWEVCERFARFGKPLHFTETTVVSGPEEGCRAGRPRPRASSEQAEQVAEFYTVLFSHPAVEAITWWDFTRPGRLAAGPGGSGPERYDPETRL